MVFFAYLGPFLTPRLGLRLAMSCTEFGLRLAKSWPGLCTRLTSLKVVMIIGLNQNGYRHLPLDLPSTDIELLEIRNRA